MNEATESPDPAPSQSLATALARCKMDLPAGVQSSIQKYLDALWEWNQRINLTRHTDYDRFVSRDVIDAVMLAEHLQEGEQVLDVGSGGGVPGALLAVLRPDLQVSVCDSVGKKARALAAIIAMAELPVPVHHARAETLLDEFRFDSLTVRAVAALPKLLTWFQPQWAMMDRLLVIKGPKWVEERGAARHVGLMHGLQLRKLSVYADPLCGAESVVLEIRKKPADS